MTSIKPLPESVLTLMSFAANPLTTLNGQRLSQDKVVIPVMQWLAAQTDDPVSVEELRRMLPSDIAIRTRLEMCQRETIKELKTKAFLLGDAMHQLAHALTTHDSPKNLPACCAVKPAYASIPQVFGGMENLSYFITNQKSSKTCFSPKELYFIQIGEQLFTFIQESLNDGIETARDRELEDFTKAYPASKELFQESFGELSGLDHERIVRNVSAFFERAKELVGLS